MLLTLNVFVKPNDKFLTFNVVFLFISSISFSFLVSFKYGKHLFQETSSVAFALNTFPTFEAFVATSIYVVKYAKKVPISHVLSITFIPQ